MPGYTKLDSSLATSTIMGESPVVFKVFVLLLSMADRDGMVESSIPGLARLANLTVADIEGALQTLESPDKYSRTPDHEGRRIKPVDGGWVLLNYEKYRYKFSKEDRLERDRLRKQRRRQGQSGTDGPTDNRTESDTCGQVRTEWDNSENSAKSHIAVATPTPAAALKTSAHSSNEQGSVTTQRDKACRTIMASEIYGKYPRKVAKAAALKAFESAIISVSKRDFDGDEKAAADWLRAKVEKYAASPQGSRSEKNLIPHPATWANAARYDDDPGDWNYVGAAAGFRGQQPAQAVPRRTAIERMQAEQEASA